MLDSSSVSRAQVIRSEEGVAPGSWVVADIGGTNARFAWTPGPGGRPSCVRTWPTRDFPSPAEAMMAYLAELKATQGADFVSPSRAAWAVATAPSGDRVEFTNSHWNFSIEDQRRRLGLSRLHLLNDFEALAAALPYLEADQVRAWPSLPAGIAVPSGTLAVVGPGTGLGVASVVPTDRGWRPVPGEGGHATLSAADDYDSELLQAARRRLGAHVSAERLLSGIGLPLLHACVGDVEGQQTDTRVSAEQIVNQGLTGETLCSRTIDVFCALLGSFAGNVVLVTGARGGLYIGGGIVPRLGERFFQSDFHRRFVAKGRFEGYLREVPVALITDTLAALEGAAISAVAGAVTDPAAAGFN